MKRHLLLYLFCFGILLTSAARADELSNAAETLAYQGEALNKANSALVSSSDKIATELANGGVSKAAVESLAGSAGDIAKHADDIASSANNLANKAIDNTIGGVIGTVTKAITSATDYVVNAATGIFNDAFGLSGNAKDLAGDALDFINGGNVNPQDLISGASDLSQLTGGLSGKIDSLTSSSALGSLTGGTAGSIFSGTTSALSGGGTSGVTTAALTGSTTGTADGVTAIGPVLAPSSAQQTAATPCTPGLPCVQPKTPNDPLNPTDGPNMGGNNALKSGSAACDADFMNQVYAKAWLEADRELKAGQIAIRKPDSVLEYSCFDQMVSIVAHKIGPIFSESPDFQNKTFAHSSFGTGAYTTYMGDDSLDKALEGTVLAGIKNYQANNFSHSLMGGTGSASPAFTGKVGEDTYNCDMMNRVHFVAKCGNFGTDNQFLSFENLTTLDPRLYPAQCGKPVDAGTVDLAINKNFAFVNFDIFTNYKTLLDPGVCGPAIPTGVNVIAYEVGRDLETAPPTTSSTYPDHVCSNPGCYFDGSTCTF